MPSIRQAPQLRRDVRASAALTTAFGDRLRQRLQGAHDHLAVGIPAPPLALVEPLAGGAVAALAVAPTACREFVLDPARAAFDAWHEVLGGRRHQADFERTTAPHARPAVALEHDRHPLATVQLQGRGRRAFGHAHQNGAVSGRFAPSPTGELHLGNLRTALVAWLAARSTGRPFLVRMEDLDRVTSSPAHAARQLADLAALGIDWDVPVVRQSERFDLYRAAIERLRTAGRVYPCFCTRREIRAEIDAAAQAPHGPADGAYPGTCRELREAERTARLQAGRRPALRLRTDHEVIDLVDGIAGPFAGAVDDVVLARADGVPAYNLAVVVDDADQGVTQVVRGGDLLSSTPRQVLLQRMLELPSPEYMHVPLVLGADGQRLAKRHGAVTLADLAAEGWSAGDVLNTLAVSLDLAHAGERVAIDQLVDRFDPDRVPRTAIGLADLQRSMP